MDKNRIRCTVGSLVHKEKVTSRQHRWVSVTNQSESEDTVFRPETGEPDSDSFMFSSCSFFGSSLFDLQDHEITREFGLSVPELTGFPVLPVDCIPGSTFYVSLQSGHHEGGDTS